MCKAGSRFELDKRKNLIAHEGNKERMPTIEAAILIGDQRIRH
jgi:hypothetical protein